MAGRSFNPHEKAAILLLALGQDVAAEILRQMDREEVVAISKAMQSLGRLPQQQVDSVLQEFYRILEDDKKSFSGGPDVTASILNKAFKDKNIAHQLGIDTVRIDALDGLEPKMIVSIIQKEHPQTVALILSHLEPQQGAEVLKHLPPSLQQQVMLRIANIQSTLPEIIGDINDALKQSVARLGLVQSQKRGGIRNLSKLMSKTDAKTTETLLSQLSAGDPELAEKVRDQMFVFEDIVKLEDRSMQLLIKHVPQELWTIALRGVSPAVLHKVSSNLSSRSAQYLQEEIANGAKRRVSEVESAQSKIVAKIKELEKNGLISSESVDMV